MPAVDLDPLDQLIKEELVMSRLYSTFAEKFPQRKDFWEHIAHQGAEHAAWLQQLRKHWRTYQINIEADNDRIKTLLRFSTYLKGMIGEPDNRRVELLSAAEIAKKSEWSLIEKEVLNHLNLYGVDEDVSSLLEILHLDPAQLIERITAAGGQATKH